MSTIRKFKSKDLVLQSGKFEFGEVVKDGDTSTVDLSLVARTSNPVESWIGDMVHDLKGMFHKDPVNVDWCHDSNESIGFLDRFDTTDSEITCHGKLVSVEPGDRADKIMKQAQAGIPFESSIFFGGQGIEVEEVGSKKKLKANGQSYEGPCIVFRKWPMRGVALCPYGRDNNTSANFNFEDGEQEYSVTVIEKDEGDMADNENLEVDNTPEVKEIVTTTTFDIKNDNDKPEDNKVTGPISSDGLSGKDFIGAFGDKGALWFAEGMTYMQATTMYIKGLEDQVKELTSRLDAMKVNHGGVEVLDSDDGDVDKKKVAFDSKVADLTNKIGPNLAKFAASLNLDN